MWIGCFDVWIRAGSFLCLDILISGILRMFQLFGGGRTCNQKRILNVRDSEVTGASALQALARCRHWRAAGAGALQALARCRRWRAAGAGALTTLHF